MSHWDDWRAVESYEQLGRVSELAASTRMDVNWHFALGPGRFRWGRARAFGLNRTILGIFTGEWPGAKGAKVTGTGQSFHLGYSSVECVCVCNGFFFRATLRFC